MVAALATTPGTERTSRHTAEPRARGRSARSAITTVELVGFESLPETASYSPQSASEADMALDGGLIAAVGEMLRSQRADAAASVASSLIARGVDPTVCAFLEDDLREAAEALADAEAYFQETMDALCSGKPTAGVLMERAADATVLERVDHLHQVLSNMRRRLVQVAAGVRHADRPRRR